MNDIKIGTVGFILDSINERVMEVKVKAINEEDNTLTVEEMFEINRRGKRVDRGIGTRVAFKTGLFEDYKKVYDIIDELNEKRYQNCLNEIGDSAENLLLFPLIHYFDAETVLEIKTYKEKAKELLGIDLDKVMKEKYGGR